MGGWILSIYCEADKAARDFRKADSAYAQVLESDITCTCGYHTDLAKKIRDDFISARAIFQKYFPGSNCNEDHLNQVEIRLDETRRLLKKLTQEIVSTTRAVGYDAESDADDYKEILDKMESF
jgi:hypothetical protein